MLTAIPLRKMIRNMERHQDSAQIHNSDLLSEAIGEPPLKEPVGLFMISPQIFISVPPSLKPFS